MTLDPQSAPQKMAWVPLVLMLAALLMRFLSAHEVLPVSWGNFSPLVALAFVGAVVFPRTLPWWSWVVLLLVFDLATRGLSLGSESGDQLGLVLIYGCYALVALAGSRLRDRAGIVDTLIGTLVCSVLFYLASNTITWWSSPSYTQNFSGWFQALTVGIPGPWPTTLEFFRNSLVADQIGAAVLLAAHNGEALARGLRRLPWMNLTQSR